MSNTKNYLRAAANRIKGELATVREEIAKANETKGGILWLVLCDLLVYAQNSVFNEGYTKKLARKFKLDLVSETGLSEKQAAKYTESISAALGVRGVRKGMKAIEGLVAACDDSDMVQAFLKSCEIDTFNKFQKAVRVEATPVQTAAKALLKLTPKQRDAAREMADKHDADSDDGEEA